MFSCPICKKPYETLKAMKEHAKISRTHFLCDYCDRMFRSPHTLGRHVDTKHIARENEERLYTCHTCNRSFASQSSLDEHYRGSNVHPVCSRCGKGFKDQWSFDEHEQLCPHHALEVICRSCHIKIKKNDMLKHYLDSPNHPTCLQCKVGFVDDSAFEQHCLRLHDIARCKRCRRQYDSVFGLERAKKHATCSTCENGSTRDRQEDIISQLQSDPKNEEDSKARSLISQTSSPEIVSRPNTLSYQSVSRLSVPIVKDEDRLLTRTSCISHTSTQASPVSRPSVETAQQWLLHEQFPAGMKVKNRSSSSTPVTATPIVDDNNVSSILEPKNNAVTSGEILPSWYIDPPSPPSGDLLSPEVRTPVGLDAIPTISPSPSSPISQSVITPAHPDSWPQWQGFTEKKILRPSLPSIVTGTSGRPVDSVKSSVSTSLAQGFAVLGLDKTNDSLFNTQAPDLSSPALRHDLTWNFDPSTNLGSNGVCIDRQWSSIQPSSYQKAVARPSSTSTSFSTVNSGSHSEGCSSTAGSCFSPLPVATVSLHCRLCMRDPCVHPTATMCGHIFCGNCITESVIISPRCPVCQHALLLYCLFQLDLSP
ncbi:hypothetical protein F5890DRAFT_1547050 [Lentinula detonsa]|uniref:RING-type domain-containing protein n=1 Tax=Lentinula detonsa TaxID=2804962 RepID=A0AA38UMC4_9AGAR|nr:hypothetical protein F5890DRAFT_1547050 [Lentinula detonsa]